MLFCSEPIKTAGPVKEGLDCFIEFEIKNIGEETYHVKPWASCGCSTPIIDKDTVAPGETIVLKIKFDTLGKVGVNEKSAGLWYGDKNRLTVKFIVTVIK